MERIEVLMSTYKGARWLEEQLESIRMQENVCLRLLVRDDGSPDQGETLALLRKFQSEHPDMDMHIIEGANLGFVGSFSELVKEGLKDKEAQYFAFADQDDVWKPEKLSVGLSRLKELEANEANEMPMMYCSNTELVDTGLNHMRNCWGDTEVMIAKPRSLVQSFATGCTMVFNRAAAQLYCERFRPEIRVHDYWMYLICTYFGKVVYDPIPHILYRQHGGNQIGQPGFLARWKRRLSLNWDRTHATERQTRIFLETFRDMLTVEDVEIISRIAFYRRNIFSKLSLIADGRFRRSTLESNIIQCIKIIKGGI